MNKVMWISRYVPYDKVPHAGGQIENYYIKGIKRKTDYSIKLISFAHYGELKKIDLDHYGIEYDVDEEPTWGIKKILFAVEKRIRLLNMYSGKNALIPWMERSVIHKLKSYKSQGYTPEIIILQWTQMVFLIKKIKNIYPTSKIICIEEDVMFLSYERRIKVATNFIEKIYRRKLYENVKCNELTCLGMADLVIVNNIKDKLLLHDNGIRDKVFQWTPYHQSFLDVEYIGDTKDIIFYGAMSRYENYASAIWFIENVFQNILDKETRFIILGNKPDKSLLKYINNRIIVTGYVDDVSAYFKHAMCLVAPLVLGAGVKIKIIESLSMGIPILTNDIGIEGIPAKDGETYYHCNEPNDYIIAINNLIKDKHKSKNMSMKQKELSAKEYNIEKSLDKFVRLVGELINN